MNLLAERNVGLIIDKIDDVTLERLLTSHLNRIGYIGISNFDTFKMEDVERINVLRKKYEVNFLADSQLAGGYTAIAGKFLKIVNIWVPDLVTVASGSPCGAVSSVLEARKEVRSKTKVLLTGVLPETKSNDLGIGLKSHDPVDFTIRTAQAAELLKADGVIGAAVDAPDFEWAEMNLEYHALGISPDGQNYGSKVHTTTLVGAFGKCATVAYVGSSIMQASNDVDERVEIFGKMLGQTT